jgi:ferredoxin
LCLTSAIQLDDPISLEAEKCIACGACINICPTGAITGDDGATKLSAFISRLPKGQAIDLVCRTHPAAETSFAKTDVVIRIDHCLAALGPSVYASVLLAGCSRVTLRLDACLKCSLNPLTAHIKQTVFTVQQIIGAHNRDQITFIESTNAVKEVEPSATAQVVKVKQPPVSRRDFLRSLLPRESQADAAVKKPFSENTPPPHAAIPVKRVSFSRRELIASLTTQRSRRSAPSSVVEYKEQTSSKHPSLERQRLIGVLQGSPQLWDHPVPVQIGAARISADERCTACGVCARVCPTSALEFTLDARDVFQLRFSAGRCTDCGICIQLCEPDALQRAPLHTLRDLIEPEMVTLITLTLRACSKCGVKFAGSDSVALCPICEFRRKNPFGSRMPGKNQKQA